MLDSNSLTRQSSSLSTDLETQSLEDPIAVENLDQASDTDTDEVVDVDFPFISLALLIEDSHLTVDSVVCLLLLLKLSNAKVKNSLTESSSERRSVLTYE